MNLHLDMKYAAPQLLVPDITRALGQAITLTPLSAIAMVGIQRFLMRRARIWLLLATPTHG